MSCSRTQHSSGRFRTPDLSLRSPTLYHWATALPKCADRPAHLHSLISTFVVRCLDSLIPLVSITKISNLQLALWLRRPVWVLPGRKPRRQVFSWQGSVGSFRSSLTWVYTVCKDLAVQILESLWYMWAASRENLISRFPTRVDSNRPVQAQRLAKVLKFWIYQV